MWRAFGVAVVAALLACASTSQAAVDDDTMITLRRTACYGPCPVYSVGVTHDGTVHFYGAANTTVQGYATASIGRPAFVQLLAFVRGHNFQGLKDKYARRATDHPGAVVLLRTGQTEKIVEHDQSNDEEPNIRAIEDEIDRIAQTARWIGKDAPARSGSPAALPPEALKNMLGDQLVQLRSKCKGTAPTKITIFLSIDEKGHGQSGGGSGGDATAMRCVQQQIPNLRFPIASVYNASPLELQLGS